MADKDKLSDFNAGDYQNYLLFLAAIHMARIPRLRRLLDPSDVVQDAMVKAVEKAAQFRGDTKMEYKAWLRTILINTLRDKIRVLLRNLDLDRSLDDLDQSSDRMEKWLSDEQSTPSERADRNEQFERLADEVAELPKNQQRAVLLRYYSGCTVNEIAEQMGSTRASAAGLLRRALDHLREAFPKE